MCVVNPPPISTMEFLFCPISKVLLEWRVVGEICYHCVGDKEVCEGSGVREMVFDGAVMVDWPVLLRVDLDFLQHGKLVLGKCILIL